MSDWWKYAANIDALAKWLYNNDKFRTIEEVLYFHEKPWKYEYLWREYQDSLLDQDSESSNKV